MPEARRALDDSARFVKRVTAADDTARSQKIPQPRVPPVAQSSDTSILS
jgi:epsilon-lactone hydrolase